MGISGAQGGRFHPKAAQQELRPPNKLASTCSDHFESAVENLAAPLPGKVMLDEFARCGRQRAAAVGFSEPLVDLGCERVAVVGDRYRRCIAPLGADSIGGQ